MTKTTTPKAPRMTKAEKLAKIELETQAVEAQIAAEKAAAQEATPAKPEALAAASVAVVRATEALAKATEAEQRAADRRETERRAKEEQRAADRREVDRREVEADESFNELYVSLAKPMKVVKTVKTGVGAQILQLIADGVLSNKEIVAKVLEDNPARKTSYACVAWYKSQVKAGKIDLPAAQEEVMD